MKTFLHWILKYFIIQIFWKRLILWQQILFHSTHSSTHSLNVSLSSNKFKKFSIYIPNFIGFYDWREIFLISGRVYGSCFEKNFLRNLWSTTTFILLFSSRTERTFFTPILSLIFDNVFRTGKQYPAHFPRVFSFGVNNMYHGFSHTHLECKWVNQSMTAEEWILLEFSHMDWHNPTQNTETSYEIRIKTEKKSDNWKCPNRIGIFSQVFPQ